MLDSSHFSCGSFNSKTGVFYIICSKFCDYTGLSPVLQLPSLILSFFLSFFLSFYSYISPFLSLFLSFTVSFLSVRIILDSKYNLKRWQIGEIASKIGQLYYHY